MDTTLDMPGIARTEEIRGCTALRRGVAQEGVSPTQRSRGCLSACGPGTGLLQLTRVSGATAVTRRLAPSPLKLLTPGAPPGCAHVVTSTYGGGLLAGDDVQLRVIAGAGTRCAITTQASTKVYRSADGRAARQRVDAELHGAAVLAVAPDPVTPFAGARYEQRQHFSLAPDASLLLVDWFTSGRAARGERWAFDRYSTVTTIDVQTSTAGGTPAPRRVARDALVLDGADGSIDAPHRAGRFDCFATVFLVGPAFERAAQSALERVARLPVRRGATAVVVASPLRGGVVLRVAGGGTEPAGRVLADYLAPAWSALGYDPWARKW